MSGSYGWAKGGGGPNKSEEEAVGGWRAEVEAEAEVEVDDIYRGEIQGSGIVKDVVWILSGF